MIENWASIIRAVIGIIALIPAIYVLFVQIDEYLQPKDKYTGIKIRLLFLNNVFIVTMIPVIVYQILRGIGVESQLFRMIVTIVSGFGPLAMSLAWYFIYKHKIDK